MSVGCDVIGISPATLPDGVVGSSYAATLGATGGVGPYTFAVTGGSLTVGLSLSAQGSLSGVPTAAGTATFDVTLTDGAGCKGIATRDLTIHAPATAHVSGEGLGQPNGNRVVSDSGADLLAYAAGQWGVNVAGGDLDAVSTAEILTGPGPGAVFGPQARAFRSDGLPVAKANFYAYGTLKYGLNVAGADVDGDGFSEVLTGPGPGTVFGPHVRAFDYDGLTLRAIAKVSYFAYGTLKYGARVGGGDVDGDGLAEILTGPGPGAIFPAQVRAFDYDGVALTPITKINFIAFAGARYGVDVAAGDVDGDGYAELGCAPGPSPVMQGRFVGFDYDAAAVAALPGFDRIVHGSLYGGRVALGDLDPDGRAELVTGAGPDPAAGTIVVDLDYDGAQLLTRPGSFDPFGGNYGVNVATSVLTW